MKIWAVANQKGGVGKTTSAVSLGGRLVQYGFRVLLVDLDPHASLSNYFGYDPDGVEDSVYRLFADERPPPVSALVRETAVDGLDLVAANTALATLDRQMGIRNSMGLVIGASLKQLQSRFDYVLLDCPPVLGILMVNALAACHRLIVPVQAEYLALKGLERMQRTVAMMNKAGRPAIPYTVVPTMFDRRTRESFRSLEHLRNRCTPHIWPSVIPVDTQFREASRRGLPICFAAPGSRGTLAYAALVDDLLGTVREPAPLAAAR